MPRAAIDPASTRIAWIGTGVMGSSMCGRLMDAGFAATVQNRTKSKTDALVARGGLYARLAAMQFGLEDREAA